MIMIVILFVLCSIYYIKGNSGTTIEKIASSNLLKKIEEDEDISRIDYVDEEGKNRIASDLGYSTVIKTKNGSSIVEEYLDNRGLPVTVPDGYCAIIRDYNADGNNIETTYLGLDKNPVLISSGYAIERKSYNEIGEVLSVRYFDTKGTPVCTSSFGYGRNYRYDEYGNISVMTYVNEAGDPYITGLGYATVKRTYYETIGNEKAKTEYEFYFDDKEQPIRLSLGQYGIHKEYDENGNNYKITYLDIDGTPILTTKGYGYIIRSYYSDNSLATEQYYDLEGTPVSLSEGQYGKKTENGKTTYLDVNGREQFNIRNLFYNQSWLVIAIASLLVAVSSITNRKMNYILLLIYFGGIIYFTLMFRETGIDKLNVQLFWSYRKFLTNAGTRADILKNIWLFIPLGAILYKVYPRKRILLASVLLSIIIELTQYVTGAGLCELDDVISNGLGGCIGFGAGQLLEGTVKTWIRKLHDGLKAQ